MRLRVLTRTEVILDEDVVHVTVEDGTGSLGIRPGHTPLVTPLVPGILVARGEDGRERYAAINSGVLLVNDDVVEVVSREAAVSDDLEHIENTVLERFRSDVDSDRSNRTAYEKMRIGFLRRLMEFELAGQRR